MRARLFLSILALGLGICLVGRPTLINGEPTGKMHRVGWLEVSGAPRPGAARPGFELFRARLAEHGYVEGKNLVIEQRFAGGRYERMADLATEIVRAPVDVLFALGTRTSRIVSEAVRTTPVVIYSCDPFHYVTSLARPGGNLTGVTCMTTELTPKRLELLKEAVPKASRVTFLHGPEDVSIGLKMAQEAAPRLGIELLVSEVKGAQQLPSVFTAIAKERPDALLVWPDLVSHREQLAAFAIKHGIPTMNPYRSMVDAGGLMSYGASFAEIYAVAAEQVASILAGARPSDLPVRQVTRFELVINRSTAKALRLTIPPSLLLRADLVIE